MNWGDGVLLKTLCPKGWVASGRRPIDWLISWNGAAHNRPADSNQSTTILLQSDSLEHEFANELGRWCLVENTLSQRVGGVKKEADWLDPYHGMEQHTTGQLTRINPLQSYYSQIHWSMNLLMNWGDGKNLVTNTLSQGVGGVRKEADWLDPYHGMEQHTTGKLTRINPLQSYYRQLHWSINLLIIWYG